MKDRRHAPGQHARDRELPASSKQIARKLKREPRAPSTNRQAVTMIPIMQGFASLLSAGWRRHRPFLRRNRPAMAAISPLQAATAADLDLLDDLVYTGLLPDLHVR